MTLVELTVVLAIVALLTTLAVPLYSSHVTRVRRGEAMDLLLRLWNQQENFFSRRRRYATADELGLPRITRYYTVTMPTLSGTDFTLLATPRPDSSQAGTGALRTDASGLRRWDKANNGSFGSDWTER